MRPGRFGPRGAYAEANGFRSYALPCGNPAVQPQGGSVQRGNIRISVAGGFPGQA